MPGVGAGLSELFFTASVLVLPVLLAITMHEAAHGYVAWRLGDDTAKGLGRVSFNPLRHIDPVGTIILPAMLMILKAPFLFGWAKPVPVDFRRLGHPRRDMVLVAAAGPAANLLLATVSALMFHLVPLLPESAGEWLEFNLYYSILINLVLAVFNMIPLPPLDGGRVAVGLLPRSLAQPLARLERYGMLIIIGVIFVLPLIGKQFGMDFSIFHWLIGAPIIWLLVFFNGLAGGAL